ncbi:MAG TPA: methyltransferase, TIGR04325 family [Acetobacteraceae bacterium]|nr:methyltransferase, TIGR04325 family [Acetobacteraceae bacterium]
MAARRPILSLVAAGMRRGQMIIADTPLVRAVRWKIHRADFAAGRCTDTFSGRYASFAEAESAAPPGLIGYNHDAMTGFYQPDANAPSSHMDANDYAALFWLQRLLPNARRVFELGGYIGNAYYNYRRYLEYPNGLEWTVCDVPAVVRAGTALARREGVTQLRFTEDQAEAEGADILLAAGSLQYLEEGSLHRLIGTLRARPLHVLVQRTPLHPERSFVTLQVMTPPGGPVFCPYTVAARQRFINDLNALGYDLVDFWSKQRELLVPLHPECRVTSYSGLYFRLTKNVV